MKASKNKAQMDICKQRTDNNKAIMQQFEMLVVINCQSHAKASKDSVVAKNNKKKKIL